MRRDLLFCAVLYELDSRPLLALDHSYFVIFSFTLLIVTNTLYILATTPPTADYNFTTHARLQLHSQQLFLCACVFA